MDKILRKLVSKKGMTITAIVFVVLLIASIGFAFMTKVNYNMSLYLPEDSKTKQSMEVFEEEFGLTTMLQVMISDTNNEEVAEIVDEVKQIEGVKSVNWLGDVADLKQPVDAVSNPLVNRFYKDGNYLLTIEMNEDEYSLVTDQAIDKTQDYLKTKAVTVNYRGPAMSAKTTRDLTARETLNIMAVVVPVALIILIIGSTSWIEPVVVLISLLTAIVINLGVNGFMPNISFITMAMASALQLAVSLDYSLFFVHRYYEKREAGMDKRKAAVSSMKDALGSVTASCLTTVFGFLALVFMRYRIGADIGINLAKAVFISYLVALFMMPMLLIVFDKWLLKSKHKSFVPNFKKIGGRIHKGRFPIVAIFLVVMGIAVVFQSKTKFFYGDQGVLEEDDPVVVQDVAITNEFGYFQPVVILYDKDAKTEAVAVAEVLQDHELIDGIDSIVTSIPKTIPSDMIPAEYLDRFVGDKYARMIVSIKVMDETEDMYQVAEDIERICKENFGDNYYTLGYASSITEIKDTVTADGIIVQIISVVTIALIVGLIFKSISIPIVLVLVIQTAIWINFAIPYFTDKTLTYIGYLVVSSLQLGATIDYAVLLTSRYMEFREQKIEKKQALSLAMQKSVNTILVSCFVLAAAGFVEMLMSNVPSVSEMGLLIGRGVLLSGLLVLVALPALLVLLDKPIQMLTFNKKKNKEENIWKKDL